MSSYACSFSEIQDELDQFDAIIDTRSPSEYACDHVKGAINLPVLYDEERHRVGTLYVQSSPFEARKVGAALVARNIARHLDETLLSRSRDFKPLVYCWRGGERSAAMTHVLSRIGWRATQLTGGYKAYRRAVIDGLELLCGRFDYRVLCGPTGSGKSRLLAALAKEGAQVLDLEGLANHRGSVLGSWPDHRPQPGQRRFESSLWDALRSYRIDRPVYVEAESRKIGDLRVPASLTKTLQTSRCVAVELPSEERVRLLLDDYQHLLTDPTGLKLRLSHLTSRHGRERIALWHGMVSGQRWPELVRSLLETHYDAAYRRSLAQLFSQAEQAQRVMIDAADAACYRVAARTLIDGSR